ncbi:MAG: hypothetical protein M3T49_01910 [Candidatus Eremiobacteraeota bacterium]|nr:hypothetical protein [Candidatus Eremiobacteraeota bacterium]
MSRRLISGIQMSIAVVLGFMLSPVVLSVATQVHDHFVSPLAAITR